MCFNTFIYTHLTYIYVYAQISRRSLSPELNITKRHERSRSAHRRRADAATAIPTCTTEAKLKSIPRRRSSSPLTSNNKSVAVHSNNIKLSHLMRDRSWKLKRSASFSSPLNYPPSNTLEQVHAMNGLISKLSLVTRTLCK